ncbi:hypothetical protein Pmani_009550 [Petrolisthes manimaculis]|uniref:Uncharacterized protein n=1 Tax=Petrolisthes manimaculis TaxID=1843537 RepID=A0AAE1Q4J3_9EUCA|nr:hypothetical protein Pmani_009550 [Petrolisthes manimaculis]
MEGEAGGGGGVVVTGEGESLKQQQQVAGVTADDDPVEDINGNPLAPESQLQSPVSTKVHHHNIMATPTAALVHTAPTQPANANPTPTPSSTTRRTGGLERITVQHGRLSLSRICPSPLPHQDSQPPSPRDIIAYT